MYLNNLILILDRGRLVYQLYCYVPPSLNRVLTYLLLQEPDVTEDEDRIISFAPGEGNKPLGIFMDKDSEYYSLATIFCGKQRPDNSKRKVAIVQLLSRS